MFDEKKRVIIVHGKDKEGKYAHVLKQVLCKIENIELMQPINEDEYKTTFATIEGAGDVYVIFFGNGNETELQGKAIQWQFDKFGMKYGWLGKYCVITADMKNLTLDKRNDFEKYFNSRAKEVQSRLNLNNINLSKVNNDDTNYLEDYIETIKWDEYDDWKDKAKKTVGAIIGAPLLAAVEGAKNLQKGMNRISAAYENTHIWEAHYKLLIGEFMLNGFEKFINNVGKETEEQTIAIVFEDKNEYAKYAYLLRNLIRQYDNYDVVACTEKVFNDTKKLSARQKIIFIGESKTAKLRNANLEIKYNKHSMIYGWASNDCFINADSSKIIWDDFLNYYNDLGKKYEDKVFEAEAYKKKKHDIVNKTNAITLSFHTMGIGLPLVAYTFLRDKSERNAEIRDFQYQLLLREFLFNGFEKFMKD